ncbi:MAG: hypothetical protein QOJ62_1850 [Actinomycetota bacterium]|nr:hypothetical protein [Actinomycetota bacterium]
MTAGVVTGEAVALDVRAAHWPSRVVALVIDVAAQFALLLVLMLIVSKVIFNIDADLRAAILLIILLFVVVGYPVLFETLWRGRSLGKAALGLRVVRDDGGPERFRHALIRGVLWPLECWGPGLIASVVSKRGKRLGDLLAGTIVVQERVPGRTSVPVAMPPQLAWWATTLDLSRLGDDLALAIRQFLGRQHELHAASRDAMGNQLVAAVQAVVSTPPPVGTPGWAYLTAVLAERRRREEQRMYASQPTYGSVPGGYGPQPHQAFVQPQALAAAPTPAPTYDREDNPRPSPERPPAPAAGPFAPPQ